MPPSFPPLHLALTGVHPGANVNAQVLDPIGDSPTTTHGARRSIEARKKSISRGINLPSAVALKFLTNKKMVMIEKFTPPAVPYYSGVIGRANNVREQNCSQHAIRASQC
jgi:hypothetical protein